MSQARGIPPTATPDPMPPAAAPRPRTPLPAAAVVGRTPSLKEPQLLGGFLYWQEQRPQEKGRTTLLRRRAGAPVEAAPEELTPATGICAVGSTAMAAGPVLWAGWRRSPRQALAVRTPPSPCSCTTATAASGAWTWRRPGRRANPGASPNPARTTVPSAAA